MLVLQAQVLAGRGLDRTGAEVALGADELWEAWRRLHERDTGGRPAAPRATSRSRIAWYRREARRLELDRQGAAAAWHLDRLVSLQPGDPSLITRLVAACEMAGDWEGLERSASRAIATGSDDVEVRIRRGWARLFLGRPADAAADFREALEQQPRSSPIRVGLFAAEAEMGNLVEADSLWRDVMNDREESRPARWVNICNHLARLEDASPKKWWLHRARGHALLQAGHPDQSEVDYGRAIALKPEDGWSDFGRGLARRRLRRSEDAFADFVRCTEVSPRIAGAWGAMGEVEGLRGRWDEAARRFAPWAELGGEPLAFSWFDHAALRLRARDREGYRRACAAIWERFGRTRDPFVASLVARACSLAPDPGIPADKVIELARLGVKEHSREGWYLSTLGAPLFRAGRLEDALAQFDEALRGDPGWVGAPLIEALRDLAFRARAPRDSTAATREEHQAASGSQVDFSKLTARMAKAKAPWNLGLEAELLVREHDEGLSPLEKPP